MADILSNDRLHLGRSRNAEVSGYFRSHGGGHPLRSVTAPTPRPPHIIFGEKEVCNGVILERPDAIFDYPPEVDVGTVSV
jgi:hypothetical protein